MSIEPERMIEEAFYKNGLPHGKSKALIYQFPVMSHFLYFFKGTCIKGKNYGYYESYNEKGNLIKEGYSKASKKSGKQIDYRNYSARYGKKIVGETEYWY